MVKKTVKKTAKKTTSKWHCAACPDSRSTHGGTPHLGGLRASPVHGRTWPQWCAALIKTLNYLPKHSQVSDDAHLKELGIDVEDATNAWAVGQTPESYAAYVKGETRVRDVKEMHAHELVAEKKQNRISLECGVGSAVRIILERRSGEIERELGRRANDEDEALAQERARRDQASGSNKSGARITIMLRRGNGHTSKVSIKNAAPVMVAAVEHLIAVMSGDA